MWHGAAWNFIAWGVYYGVLLLLEKYLLRGIKEKLPGVLNVLTTLLAVLEYMAHIWGVTLHRDQLWFSLGSGHTYTYEQEWNGHRYRIQSDGREAAVFFDGVETLRSACGVRLITDLQGRLLDKRIIE